MKMVRSKCTIILNEQPCEEYNLTDFKIATIATKEGSKHKNYNLNGSNFFIMTLRLSP